MRADRHFRSRVLGEVSRPADVRTLKGENRPFSFFGFSFSFCAVHRACVRGRRSRLRLRSCCEEAHSEASYSYSTLKAGSEKIGGNSACPEVNISSVQEPSDGRNLA
jgi:hypothetical protein